MLSRLYSTGISALMNQAIVSFGTFAFNLILARLLSVSDYGQFVIINSIYLFLFNFYSGFIVYPTTISIASEQKGFSSRNEIKTALTVTIGFSVITGIPSALMVTYLTNALSIGFVTFAMIFMGLCQELFRRSLMARLAYLKASLGDGINYLGRCIAIAGLSLAIPLPLWAILFVVAATAAIAVSIQLRQVRIDTISLWPTTQQITDYWRKGQWNIYSMIPSILIAQGIPWMLALFHGVTAVAQLQAVVNILSACHPFLFGFSNLIIPYIAMHKTSSESILKNLVILSMMLLTPLFSFIAYAFFDPGKILATVYGQSSPYTGSTELVRISATYYLILALNTILSAVLLGQGRAKSNFLQNVVSSATTLIVGIPMIMAYGVFGALVTSVVSVILGTFAALYVLLRLKEH